MIVSPPMTNAGNINRDDVGGGGGNDDDMAGTASEVHV